MQEEETKQNNMTIYNELKNVPKEAQKPITGGRLNGMTDIKPMWRIQKLTEVFGMCGFGWKAPIKNKEIIEGANGEKIAIVDIDLYVKVNGEWSEPIEGTGGSSFITKEKSGLYTSDECFKMAYTDAISVACKSLGMGADVYWGDSKYTTKTEVTEEDAKNYVFGFGKHSGKKLTDVISEDYQYIKWLLNSEKTDKEVLKCIELLTGEVPLTKKEQDEIIHKMNVVSELLDSTNTDREKFYKHYNVSSNGEMTLEQLDDAIKKLMKKV
jgi:Trp operon repressor